jgi:hypothetical protein
MLEREVTVAVEGATDVPVVKRLLATAGLTLGPVYIAEGKSRLDDRLNAYNRAAARSPWLVVRDLNGDEPCASVLVGRLLPAPARHMRFRIAVHSMESWLLADKERIARYLAVSPARITASPDSLLQPKLELLSIVRHSRNRSVREDILPLPGTSATIGPGYTQRVTEFATTHWRPAVAAESSPSLDRCLAALRAWSAA